MLIHANIVRKYRTKFDENPEATSLKDLLFADQIEQITTLSKELGMDPNFVSLQLFGLYHESLSADGAQDVIDILLEMERVVNHAKGLSKKKAT